MKCGFPDHLAPDLINLILLVHGVQESETDEEEESTLSEALDDVHVDADAARQPSKKRRALVSSS